MPVAVEIDVAAPSFIEVPDHRLHAIACALAQEDGDDHTAPSKPWSVWPFRDVRSAGLPPGTVRLRLRLNWLDDQRLPAGLGKALPASLRLGKYRCRVARRSYEISTYRSLARGPGLERARLEFHRPVFFRHNGRTGDRIGANLIVGSLARRWNRFSPVDEHLADDVVRALKAVTFIDSVDLRAADVAFAGRSQAWGAVGEVTLGLPSDHALSGAFGTLMRASEFLGVGAGTTSGYGVVMLGQKDLRSRSAERAGGTSIASGQEVGRRSN